MDRVIDCRYQDPVELLWIHAARQIGMCVQRSPEVNASWDGRGTLWIGTPETLDPDDSLAQMILHEICHALCEGPGGWDQPDWGLQSDRREHRVREYACLRLQAQLADSVGLRRFFAATTVFRRYYDRIPAEPLADLSDPAVQIARPAWVEATTGPWSTALLAALNATAQIAALVRPVADEGQLWSAASETAS